MRMKIRHRVMAMIQVGNMLVSPERVEKALRLLAETDTENAQWRGAVLRTEHMAKVAEALAYQQLDKGMTVEDRKRAVLLVPEVQKAHEEHFSAVTEAERLKARRQREVIIVELFRTLEASRRLGNVT